MNIKEFKLLNYDEEAQLDIEGKKEYYKQLREYLLQRPLQVTTKGATTIAPKLKGVTNHLAKMTCKLFSAKNSEWISEGQENIPEGPVIFAQSHQGILDNFVWIPEIKPHCIILHSADVNKFLLTIQLNTGLILVKKGDKENNLNAKLDQIELLLLGHSIACFPESTWNLSPNKLHLPLNYGFLDVARKSGCPVVPVVHEFTYDTSTEKETITKIHSKFGKAISITEKDDILKKLEEYSASISTMRYEMIEEKGLEKRSSVTNIDYINFLKGNYKNLKLGHIDREKESKNIYRNDNDFYEFHHINEIPFDDKGNFKDTEEVLKLKVINAKHHI
jgi:1-acyl-sn-glycerol-3-phosphate acyltransferase